MLILFAKTQVRPSAKLSFAHWYDAYIPRRLEAPGFTFCLRLVNTRDPCEIVAIYGIRSEGDLPSLLSERVNERDKSLVELAKHPLPEGIERVQTGVYALAYTHPSESLFNQTTGSFSIELWEWADPSAGSELSQNYDEMYLSYLLEYPDHIAAFRFERFSSPIVDYTNRSSSNLCIIENPADLSPGDINDIPLRADKAVLFSSRSTGLYRPVAKYWGA